MAKDSAPRLVTCYVCIGDFDLSSANGTRGRHSESGLEAVAVAFPDEGAKKRFGGFFEKAGYPVSSSAVCIPPRTVITWNRVPCQVLFCSKVREGEKRVVRVAEGDPEGKHVFIVDDLCNTGRLALPSVCRALRHGACVVCSLSIFPRYRTFRTS